MGNLNDALDLRLPKWGLLDQFSKQPLVQKYVKDRDFELQMRTKAESDPVVVASIIARATWLQQMEELENAVGCKIPKVRAHKPRMLPVNCLWTLERQD